MHLYFRETFESDLLQFRRITSSTDKVVQRRPEPVAGVNHDHWGQQGRAQQECPHHSPTQEHRWSGVSVHSLEQGFGTTSEAGDKDKTGS